MTKGYDQNKQRKDTLSSFGKDLARRSGSKCELCTASKVSLTAFEVPPVIEEPLFESCIFICETCKSQIENPKKMESGHWRCLNNAIWSEIPAIQVTAIRLLKKISADERWAQELLEEVYLDPEIEEWASQEKY